MPGAHETFGLVALEAAASGARVVACAAAPRRRCSASSCETLRAGRHRRAAARHRARPRRASPTARPRPLCWRAALGPALRRRARRPASELVDAHERRGRSPSPCTTSSRATFARCALIRDWLRRPRDRARHAARHPGAPTCTLRRPRAPEMRQWLRDRAALRRRDRPARLPAPRARRRGARSCSPAGRAARRRVPRPRRRRDAARRRGRPPRAAPAGSTRAASSPRATPTPTRCARRSAALRLVGEAAARSTRRRARTLARRCASAPRAPSSAPTSPSLVRAGALAARRAAAPRHPPGRLRPSAPRRRGRGGCSSVRTAASHAVTYDELAG